MLCNSNLSHTISALPGEIPLANQNSNLGQSSTQGDPVLSAQLVNKIFDSRSSSIPAGVTNLIQHAYHHSPTFHHLYTQWAETLSADDEKFTIQRSDVYWLAATAELIAIHGHRLELAIDASNDSLLPVISTNNPAMNMSGERALIHQLVRIFAAKMPSDSLLFPHDEVSNWVNVIQTERQPEEASIAYTVTPETASLMSSPQLNQLHELLSALRCYDMDNVESIIADIEKFILLQANLSGESPVETAFSYLKTLTRNQMHFTHYGKICSEHPYNLCKAVLKCMVSIDQHEKELLTLIKATPNFPAIQCKNLWRLCIDLAQQTNHNRFSFENEPGYIIGMYQGWKFMLENFNKKITSELLVELHDRCVDGVCDYNLFSEPVFFEKGYRNGTQELRLAMGQNLTPEGLSERRALYQSHNNFYPFKEGEMDSMISDRRDLTADQHATNMDIIISEYHNDIALAGGDPDKIKQAIVKLIIKFDLYHPFADGNIRTAVLVNIWLRLQNNLPVTVLTDPNHFDGHSVQQLIADMDRNEAIVQSWG